MLDPHPCTFNYSLCFNYINGLMVREKMRAKDTYNPDTTRDYHRSTNSNDKRERTDLMRNKIRYVASCTLIYCSLS